MFKSPRKIIVQPALQGHLGRTSTGGFKPVVEIPNLHTMLDFGLFDAHQDAGGKSEIAPFILAEHPDGLGGGFEDAPGADLDRVLDTLRIAAGDLAGADGHTLKLSLASFIRHSPYR